MNTVGIDLGREPRELASIADDVSLWWCELDHASAAIAGLAATLSRAEHARAARFGTDALRERWIAGRASLRRVLGRVLGVPAAAVPIARGRRGRPQLGGIDAGLDFNVSHTGGVALIGLRRTSGRDAAHRCRCRARGSRARFRSPRTQVPDIERTRDTRGSRAGRASPRLPPVLDVQGSDEQSDRRRPDCALPASRGGSARPCAARRGASAVLPARMVPCYCAGSGGVFRDGRVVDGGLAYSLAGLGYFQRFCSHRKSAGLSRQACSVRRANRSMISSCPAASYGGSASTSKRTE